MTGSPARRASFEGLCLSSLPEANPLGFVLVILRSRERGGFSAGERSFVKAIYPHLRNLSAPLFDPEKARRKSLSLLLSEVRLSRRESDIGALLMERRTVGEISERLFISRRTVEKHLEHIYGKLGVTGKNEAHEAILRRIGRVNPPGWSTRSVDHE
jgi:DNA-binding CsgD family transcriptional regulator